MPMANAVGGVGDAIGPDQWFKSLPFCTRYWFGSVVVMTLAGNLGFISPALLVFHWESIKNEMQLWRLVSPFTFIGKFSFPTVIACYMLVQFSKQYETGGPYNTGAGGGTADYAFCLMFGIAVIVATYPLLAGMIPPIFANNLIYYVLYIWSKRNPEANANIWGVPVPGMYLPFAYLALTVVMGNPYMDMVHGLAVGHLYYFLVDVFPQVNGKDLLITPQFLIDYFGVGEYRPVEPPREVPRPGHGGGMRQAGFGAQGQMQTPGNAPTGGGGGGAAGGGGGGGGGAGHNWGGGGRALGRQ